eukprot:3714678-Rhodomonas_salina.2
MTASAKLSRESACFDCRAAALLSVLLVIAPSHLTRTRPSNQLEDSINRGKAGCGHHPSRIRVTQADS